MMKDPATGQLRILNENHYFPFGLKHTVYVPPTKQVFVLKPGESEFDLNVVTKTPYLYEFNGKEFQDELGLNIYDMDMRQYDPAIARWVVQDPIVHFNQSPYSSFDGNPVFWADPSGAAAESNTTSASTGVSLAFGVSLDSVIEGGAAVNFSGEISFHNSDGNRFDDWVRNNKNGKITNNPNVTSEKNTPKGYDYIGSKEEDIVTFLFGKNSFTSKTHDLGFLGMEDDNRGSSAAYSFGATTTLRVLIKSLIINGEFKGVYLDASVQGIHSRGYDNSIAIGGTFNIQNYETSQSNLPRGATALISTEGSVNAFGSAFFSAQSIQNNFGRMANLNVSYSGIYGYYSGQSSWSVLTYPTAFGSSIPNYTNLNVKIPMNQSMTTSNYK